MSYVIQFRRDTAANWAANNPTLYSGEIGLETDTDKIKIGNGVDAWNSLSYWTGSRGDTGFTGSAGADGVIGRDGYTGSKGDIGYTGSQGVGFTGSQGAVGFTGSQGVQGPIGYTGSAAEGSSSIEVSSTAPASPSVGDIWYDTNDATISVYVDDGVSQQWVTVSGPAGPTGAKGYTGSKGDIGYTGSQGITGFTGSAGIDGTIAESTATAPLNPSQGQVWYDTDDATVNVYNGSEWITVSGPMGPVGPQGTAGFTGSAGTNGYTGSKGNDGDVTKGKAIAMSIMFG